MDKLKETAAWVNDIVTHALETERTNKKSNNKKKQDYDNNSIKQ